MMAKDTLQGGKDTVGGSGGGLSQKEIEALIAAMTIDGGKA
jgi:hypothetical protein